MTSTGRTEGSTPAHSESTSEDRTLDEAPKVVSSEELFAGRQEVEIQHEGESYRLRITRNGKLILHK